MRKSLSVLVLVNLWATGAQAAAVPVQIGVLTCTIAAGVVDKAGEGAREIVCSFKASSGLEETYAGLMRTVGVIPENRSVLWSVRAPAGKRHTPGFLQQSYNADAATTAGQVPQLIGARDGAISLNTMADTREGAASKEKRDPLDFVIADIDLVLKTTSG